MKRLFLGLAVLGTLVPPAVAGPLFAERCTVRFVGADGTDTFSEFFFGGIAARVRIPGDRYSGLDLFVYDRFGNLIDSDTGDDGQCEVEWTPSADGRYEIHVVSRDSIFAPYNICLEQMHMADRLNTDMRAVDRIGDVAGHRQSPLRTNAAH